MTLQGGDCLRHWLQQQPMMAFLVVFSSVVLYVHFVGMWNMACSLLRETCRQIGKFIEVSSELLGFYG